MDVKEHGNVDLGDRWSPSKTAVCPLFVERHDRVHVIEIQEQCGSRRDKSRDFRIHTPGEWEVSCGGKNRVFRILVAIRSSCDGGEAATSRKITVVLAILK